MSILNSLINYSAPPIFFLILILTAFFVLSIIKGLRWISIWQIKGYRYDRMLDFFMSRSGKKELINFFTGLEFLFVVLFFLVYFYLRELFILNLLFLLNLIGEIFFLSYLRIRPVWTLKSFLMTVLTLLGAFLSTLILDFYTNLIIATSLTVFLFPLLVFGAVILFNPLANYKKRKIIRAASNHVRCLNPKIIGITGSYGKTTTKEFLKEILRARYRVLATEKNINTDIGVAKMLLNKLQSEHEICIVEMGAYKVGEIKKICEITPPIIGIVTAVSSQHLSLFGSFNEIKNAKAELLQALPSSGLAVINYDCEACLEISELTSAIKKFYSLKSLVHVYATDIVARKDHLSFVLHIGKKASWVETNLFGWQAISSLLPAALVADHLGIGFTTIIKAIQKIKPIQGVMSVFKNSHSVTIIDDHYNSNPDGFLAALDYLALWSDKRKVVITPGMIELGSESDTLHRNVGTRLGEVADLLLITKKDNAQGLQEAAKNAGLTSDNILVFDNPQKTLKKISNIIKENDVVLLEGRCADKLFNYFFEKTK